MSSAATRCGLFFLTTIGTPALGGNVLTRSLNPLMQGAGLPQHNFQSLDRDVPRAAEGPALGHASITTTINVHAQAPDEPQEEAAKLMGELFFGREPKNAP